MLLNINCCGSTQLDQKTDIRYTGAIIKQD